MEYNWAQPVTVGVLMIVLTNQLTIVTFGHPSRTLVSMTLCVLLHISQTG